MKNRNWKFKILGMCMGRALLDALMIAQMNKEFSLLWNPKVYYRVDKSMTVNLNVSQLDSLHKSHSQILKFFSFPPIHVSVTQVPLSLHGLRPNFVSTSLHPKVCRALIHSPIVVGEIVAAVLRLRIKEMRLQNWGPAITLPFTVFARATYFSTLCSPSN